MKTAEKYFRHIVALAATVAALLVSGCSQSTNSNPNTSNATVQTTTQLAGTTVTPNSISPKDGNVITGNNGTTADSIVVTRARIVFKDLKMHLVGDVDVPDTTSDYDHDSDIDEHDNDEVRDDGTIKVGPFVAEFDSAGERIVSEITIPAGTYNRIKFEIHKLDENEDASLLNDTVFGDFVNGGRYTVIIDGWSYTGGKAYAFSYKSSLTANLTVFIDSGAVFDSSRTYDLTLVFDPQIVFGQPGAAPLDPRDPDNAHAIDKMIKQSIKALRIPR